MFVSICLQCGDAQEGHHMSTHGYEVIRHSPIGMLHFQFERDSFGKPCHSRIIEANPAMLAICGFRMEAGQPLYAADWPWSEHLAHFDWSSFLGSLNLNGFAGRFELFSIHVQHWFHVLAHPVGENEFVLWFVESMPHPALENVEIVSDRDRMESTLLFLTETGYLERGEDFFLSLAKFLAKILETDYVCIDRLRGDNLSAETVAVYYDGRFEDNVTYTLRDTPCGILLGKRICIFPSDVRSLFPKDDVLQEMNAESYIGTTLFNTVGEAIGLIATISRKPARKAKMAELILEVVSMRAAWELERRTSEEALRKAKEAAETANREKTRFFANLAHEIRTPMNGIVGFFSLLQNTTLDERQKEYVRLMDLSTHSLLGVVNDMLDLSKMEAGRLELEQIPFDLHDTVLEAVQLFQIPSGARGVPISFHFPSDMPRCFLGDPTRIRQVVRNLVGNSVKFTKTGEIVVSVELLLETGMVAVQVSDTGIGLTAEDAEKLFVPYSQVDASVSRNFGGTGLGLSLCRSLVTLMGGEIHAAGSLGVGAAFRFTMNLAIPDV